MDQKVHALEVKTTILMSLLIALAVGFAAVILIAMILQIVTNDPFVSLISFTLGIAGTAFFILTLYISDEKKDVLIKGYRAVIEKLESMIKSIKIARK